MGHMLLYKEWKLVCGKCAADASYWGYRTDAPTLHTCGGQYVCTNDPDGENPRWTTPQTNRSVYETRRSSKNAAEILQDINEQIERFPDTLGG